MYFFNCVTVKKFEKYKVIKNSLETAVQPEGPSPFPILGSFSPDQTSKPERMIKRRVGLWPLTVTSSLLMDLEGSTWVPETILAWHWNHIAWSCSSTVNFSVTKFWFWEVFSLFCLTPFTFSSNFSIVKCIGAFSSGTEQLTITTPPSMTSFLSSVTLGSDTPLGEEKVR